MDSTTNKSSTANPGTQQPCRRNEIIFSDPSCGVVATRMENAILIEVAASRSESCHCCSPGSLVPQPACAECAECVTLSTKMQSMRQEQAQMTETMQDLRSKSVDTEHERQLVQNKSSLLEAEMHHLKRTISGLQSSTAETSVQLGAAKMELERCNLQLSSARRELCDKKEDALRDRVRCEELSKTMEEYKKHEEVKAGTMISEILALRRSESALQQLVAASQAREALYEPAFTREQKGRASMATSARIGEDGEHWARESLLAIIGDHARVEDTSAIAGSGDIHVYWKPPGASREVLVVVESKHTEQTNRMMPEAYLTQTRKEIATTNADAGMILYTGPISSHAKLEVLAAERLIVVGQCRAKGQLVTGLVIALGLGYARLLIEANGQEGNVVNASDASAVISTLDMYAKMTGRARNDLYEVSRMCQKSVGDQKMMHGQAMHARDQISPHVVARLFPTTFMCEMNMPYEHKKQKSQSPTVSTSSLHTKTTNQENSRAIYTRRVAVTGGDISNISDTISTINSNNNTINSNNNANNNTNNNTNKNTNKNTNNNTNNTINSTNSTDNSRSSIGSSNNIGNNSSMNSNGFDSNINSGNSTIIDNSSCKLNPLNELDFMCGVKPVVTNNKRATWSQLAPFFSKKIKTS